jgi:hypothetical protein
MPFLSNPDRSGSSRNRKIRSRGLEIKSRLSSLPTRMSRDDETVFGESERRASNSARLGEKVAGHAITWRAEKNIT